MMGSASTGFCSSSSSFLKVVSGSNDLESENPLVELLSLLRFSLILFVDSMIGAKSFSFLSLILKSFKRSSLLRERKKLCSSAHFLRIRLCGSTPFPTSLLHDAQRKDKHVGETKCTKCEKVFFNRTKFLDHWSKCRMGGVCDTSHTFAYH